MIRNLNASDLDLCKSYQVPLKKKDSLQLYFKYVIFKSMYVHYLLTKDYLGLLMQNYINFC